MIYSIYFFLYDEKKYIEYIILSYLMPNHLYTNILTIYDL